LSATPLLSLPVGIVVERRKASSPWIDFVWTPSAALAGEPETPAWTVLAHSDELTTFFAGMARVELFPSATSNYRDNLATGAPLLWVVLRPCEADPPYELLTVTADPSEGEAFSEPGVDLVDTVPMPSSIADAVADFIAEHHVERAFFKRKRDRAEPEALGRRPRGERGGRHE
jgi:hypothetical protein